MTQKRQYNFTARYYPGSGNDYPIRGMIDLSFAPNGALSATHGWQYGGS